jgi:hypothetical protein
MSDMLGRVASIPVHVRADVDLADAADDPVLAWIVEGVIVVHPLRLEGFRRAVVGGNKIPVRAR